MPTEQALTIKSWSARLRKVAWHFKVPPIHVQEMAIPNRKKIGLLDGIGVFAGWLFGLIYRRRFGRS
jgi:hypothetical protein